MATEHEVKQLVVAEFADDNVTEDEVVLRDDGAIVIDRRATASWAQPVVVGQSR